MKLIPAILQIDTREQLPYQFAGCPSKHVEFTVLTRALPEGDYAARLEVDDGPADTAVVERKSCDDLLSTITHGRDRFERELERMRPYGFRALVIEASLSGLTLDVERMVHPASVVGSLVAFAQRYGVHVVYAGGRAMAERYTFRLLERWVRDRADARRQAAGCPASSDVGRGFGGRTYHAMQQ